MDTRLKMAKIFLNVVEKLVNSQLLASFSASNEALDARRGKSRSSQIFSHFFFESYSCKALKVNKLMYVRTEVKTGIKEVDARCLEMRGENPF